MQTERIFLTRQMAHVTSPLIVLIVIIIVQGYGTVQTVRRQNKNWMISPKRLMENKDYTMEKFIFKLRSDEEMETSIRYSLRGKGATEAPINLFTVDSMTGYVKIHGILDREDIDFYYLKGEAWFPNGKRAEEDIDLVVQVDDENDCAPVFSFEASQATGAVNETSATATYVMKVHATDADLVNTAHSQIVYTIVEQSPSKGGRMFYISQSTGEIYVRLNTLDRETQDTYSLTIKGADMNGNPGGLSGTGSVVIKIMDVNNNIPTLEMDNYEAKVMENTCNVTVLKIKALDADLIYSDNWLAVFTIVSGNEAGFFSITTNNSTNEGILVLKKALNYDELKEINLQIAVSNKAKYHSSVITKSKTYPIKIHVQNEPEGPRFQPAIKVVHVSEDHTTINLEKVITTYRAIDADTLQYATNVIYAKGEDKDNWIIIDQHTAEIHLNRFPDRESKHLVDGTYYVKIICISKDIMDKTATGTIAIQVEDFNDHCPTLTSASQTLCSDDNMVYATAVDGDTYPNAAPFEFEIGPNTKEQWTLGRLNDTTAILRPKESLWLGFYTVFLVIRDHQGKACGDDQVLYLEVCTCTEDKFCLLRKNVGPSVTLGPAGILTVLLGFLLLFLLPLLLLFCLLEAIDENFQPMPWKAKQHLIAYNTEGQGEDKELPLLVIPTELGNSLVTSGTDLGLSLHHKGSNTKDRGSHQWFSQVHLSHELSGQDFKGQSKHMYGGASDQICEFDCTAFSDAFLHEYYSQKASYFREQLSSQDTLLIYDCEGLKSPVELSIDCCRLLQEDQDLDFLNDLGPEYKTLAEICCDVVFEVESSKGTSTAPSSSHTAILNLKEEVSQSISTAKAETTRLATSSTQIQKRITSAINQKSFTTAIQSAASSFQLHENTDTVLGLENLHGAQGLLVPEGSASSDPQQVTDMLGRREVVMVKTHNRMRSSSVQHISQDQWVSDLTSSLRSVFSQEDTVQQMVQVLKDLGVCSTADLMYVNADDFARVLKPVEVRKVMACIKSSRPLMSPLDDSSATSEVEELGIGEETFIGAGLPTLKQ